MKRHRPIENGLIKVFQYFAMVGVIYFSVNLMNTHIEPLEFYQTRIISNQISLIAYFLLALYLSLPAVERRLRSLYLPIAITIATIAPVGGVVINSLFLKSGSYIITNLALWSIFPILCIPLVLIAWQYNFRSVLIFTVLIAIVDLSLILISLPQINWSALPIIISSFLRAISFGIVGQIVTEIMKTQRAQQQSLMHANAQLAKHAYTLQSLAVSQERNRLARELHDTLAHTLSGTAVNLEAIKLTIPEEMEETHYLLEQSLLATRKGLAETRRALKDLRSQTLEERGLLSSIREMVLNTSSRVGIEIELSLPDHSLDLTPDLEQCLYWIVHEAINNTITHAEASQIQVVLEDRKPGIRLSIKDNGKGFSPLQAQDDNKFGLQGLKERARISGGSLEIISQPAQGTQIVYEHKG